MARALDRVGERWTLLIVRNLLLGPKRYSDLIEELPGITTNLLAARLREMESSGLVVKRKAPPPVRAVVYELGQAGRALEPAIMELARWGGRFMTGPGGDTVNIGWGLLSLKRRYQGGVSLVAEVRVDERCFELALAPSYLTVTEASSARPDVTVSGSLSAIRAWLFAGADTDALRTSGELRVSGAEEAWESLRNAFVRREPSAEEMACRLPSRGAFPAHDGP